MFNNNSNGENSELKYMQRDLISYVRYLHAIPDILNIDIYINDQLIVSNLPYGKYTEYIPFSDGAYTISLYRAGEKDIQIISNTLVVYRDATITVVATGYLSDIALYALYDANMSMESGKAMLRFSQLSPNTPAIDITLPDGTVLFDDISFRQLKPYIQISPGEYTLHVRITGTTRVLMVVTNVNLKEDEFYTLYTIGSLGRKPPFEAILVEDGE